MDLKIDNVIARRQIHEQFADFRTLNRDAAKVRAAVVDSHIAVFVFVQPIQVLIRTRGVDHEQKLRVANPIRDQIVNNPAFIVKKERVLALAGCGRRERRRVESANCTLRSWYINPLLFENGVEDSHLQDARCGDFGANGHRYRQGLADRC